MLLDKRVEGICKVGCVLNSVVWVGITEKEEPEPRLTAGCGRAMWSSGG